ncbi:MAG: glycosyltransferase [Bacteroidetes bacterium]|nr:glycosyltransferase [Bacteroidota bacterium]
MKRIKILYIISGINYSLGFDWLDKNLDHSKYDVSYVFINAIKPELFALFESRNRRVLFLHSESKKNYPAVFIKLLSFIRQVKPDIVHCHLFEANLLGLTAAFLMRVKKRVYTRHHSTYHFDYAPHMVKFDKLINTLSTHIASISENVTTVLVSKENVRKDKIYLVNHGFELELFSNSKEEAISNLRNLYQANGRYPVIGVISRFTMWKGVHYIIEAFKDLLIEYPNAYLILANAIGEDSDQIDEKLKQLPQNSYIKISFEKDIAILYKLFDIFVHVPIDEEAEAFGQTYVEALAAGIPSVFTLSGIAREFVVHEENAIVVPFKDSKSIVTAMIKILTESPLRNKICSEGRKVVKSRFEVDVMMNALYKIYEK